MKIQTQYKKLVKFSFKILFFYLKKKIRKKKKEKMMGLDHRRGKLSSRHY